MNIITKSLKYDYIIKSPYITSFTHFFRNFSQPPLTPINQFPCPVNKPPQNENEIKEGAKITLIGGGVNIGLAAGKGLIGFLCQSPALIADSFHSLSDLISDAVTLISFRLARLPPDEDHPWGHGRYETIGSLCVSSLLLVAGYTIGVSSYNSFKTTFSTQTNDETTLLLNSLGCGVLILSLLSKEWLYRVTVKIGKKYNSSTLIANAWHHRSDALSSLMALVGFAGRLINMPVLDPIAGLIVAGMIMKTGFSIGKENVYEITDSNDLDVIPKINDVLKDVTDLEIWDNIISHKMGSYDLVHVDIGVSSTTTVSSGEQIAKRVRDILKQNIPEIFEVYVHTYTSAFLKNRKMLSKSPHSFRSETDIKLNIKLLLDDVADIEYISHIYIHYLINSISVEIVLGLDDSLSIKEASKVAADCRDLILTIQDITHVEIHIDIPVKPINDL